MISPLGKREAASSAWELRSWVRPSPRVEDGVFLMR